MPVATPPPIAPDAPTPPSVGLTDADYRHSIVDSKKTQLTSLLSNISGAPWIVDYYSQVIGRDEDLNEFQPNQLSIYQQYTLIHRLEMRIQGELAKSDDGETSVMSVTGSAIIYPGLKPNNGDAFIADIGDGRAGQFTVDTVEKLSIMEETAYQITFLLTRYATRDIVEKINRRVVREGYFQRDYLTYGQNPVITTQQLQDKKELESQENRLFAEWYRLFYSTERRTILVPGQVSSTYDGFVVKAMLSMVDLTRHPNYKTIREINVQGPLFMRRTSIWDAILKLDKTLVYDAFQPAFRLGVGSFSDYPFFEGIYFSGISNCVTPARHDSNVDRDYTDTTIYSGLAFVDLEDMRVDLASVLFANILPGLQFPGDAELSADSIFINDEVPSVHPVLVDDAYVLSYAFYTDAETGRSKFEVMLDELLTNQSINRSVLIAFCRSINTWGRLEKFYYIPILIACLKVAQRLI